MTEALNYICKNAMVKILMPKPEIEFEAVSNVWTVSKGKLKSSEDLISWSNLFKRNWDFYLRHCWKNKEYNNWSL